MKTFSQTTELVDLGGSASAAAFNLMLPVYLSCGIDMGDQYVVIGGEPQVGSRNVTLYNDYGFVRNLPDLVLGQWNHACAGFQDINGDMVGVIFLYS